MDMSSTEKQILLSLARESISTTLRTGQKLQIELANYPESLQRILSSFVTLHKHGTLRGCIGSLEAQIPLVADVVRHAYAAAFEDPRFPPLTSSELEQINIEISVLSPQTAISFHTEQELIESLQPKVDGLTLEDNYHRSTFLPSVWQQIPDRASFVQQLKLKAGLAPNYWSPNIKAWRYSTLTFSEPENL